jgi:hypothetical protein
MKGDRQDPAGDQRFRMLADVSGILKNVAAVKYPRRGSHHSPYRELNLINE